MSGPSKAWSKSDLNASESMRTQNARERFKQMLAAEFGLKPELVAKPRKVDLSMRRVEPAENEQ